MRLHYWGVMAALALLPASASAQTTGDPGQTTTTTTAQTTTTTTSYGWFHGDSHWLASGFVGSDFGASATNAAPSYGGSVGYLWRSAVGAEFLGGFTPDFRLYNNALLGSVRPDVNSYMVNLMGAIPIGTESRFQPFISGGLGAIQMRTSEISGLTGAGAATTANGISSQSQFAGNIGGGVMAFAGNWGVRADIRYFRAFNNNSVTNGTGLTTGSGSDTGSNGVFGTVLPGLDFWRANVGLAFRW